MREKLPKKNFLHLFAQSTFVLVTFFSENNSLFIVRPQSFNRQNGETFRFFRVKLNGYFFPYLYESNTLHDGEMTTEINFLDKYGERGWEREREREIEREKETERERGREKERYRDRERERERGRLREREQSLCTIYCHAQRSKKEPSRFFIINRSFFYNNHNFKNCLLRTSLSLLITLRFEFFFWGQKKRRKVLQKLLERLGPECVCVSSDRNQ